MQKYNLYAQIEFLKGSHQRPGWTVRMKSKMQKQIWKVTEKMKMQKTRHLWWASSSLTDIAVEMGTQPEPSCPQCILQRPNQPRIILHILYPP